ncbi:hypothetical protein [Streptomyces mirabilis]|uniref:hypothetical protein n=1 Tax=Streptomyces mirabilis TaxID=68239 RepID=UPI003318EFCF
MGCDAGGEEAATGRKGPKKTAAVEVVAPADVEVIANLTGCEVTIRIEATELREGACHTETGDYLITTFPEECYRTSCVVLQASAPRPRLDDVFRAISRRVGG